MKPDSISPILFKLNMKKWRLDFSFGWRGIDKRAWKFWWQRRTRGWDDSETWALDSVIAEFCLPRIKRFKEIKMGYPADISPEKWDEILGKIIFALEQSIDENDFIFDGETAGQYTERMNRKREGLKLFGKYFPALWW